MNLRIKLVRVDRGAPPPGFFIDHENVMHIVYEGSFLFQSKRDVYAIGPGDVILMPPNTLHALKRIEGIHMTVIHFTDLSRELDVQPFHQVIHLADEVMSSVTSLSEILTANWNQPESFSNTICEGLLHTITGIFLHHNVMDRKDVHSGNRFTNWKIIESAVQLVQERYADPNLSIREISAKAGVSYNYFCALFRDYTHETPLHYLNRTRVESAKELMFNRNHNATEAGLACGFKSLFYFTKVFKRYEGAPPKRWLTETRSLGEV